MQAIVSMAGQADEDALWLITFIGFAARNLPDVLCLDHEPLNSPVRNTAVACGTGHLVHLSHQLGGYDGVSVEAGQWMVAFQQLGLRVTPAAGRLLGPCASGLPLPSLWRPEGPDGRLLPPPALTEAEIGAVIAAAGGPGGWVVLDNIATMPTAPEAIIRLVAALEEARMRLLVRHHDPSWEEASRPADSRFPLDPPGAVHVAISAHLAHDLEQRRGIRATVMHNPLPLEALAAGDRLGLRAGLGVGPNDLVLLHPVTPYPRKAVAAAARFADAVAGRWPGTVVYWLTGGSQDPLAGEGRYRFLKGRCGSQADLYAAADAVLLPSSWEGWGNPVAEAAALGLPVVTGHWPALEEMRALGVRDIPVAAPDGVERLLGELERGPSHLQASLREALDGSRLAAELARLIGLA